MLWLRGSTWGATRGLSHSEREHASAVIPPQAVLRARSACGTCPTDIPSATSLPGSQVLFEISASDCQSPERDLGLSFAAIRFIFFFNLQLYLKHVTCLWLLTEYSVFWFCDLTFLLLTGPADAALSADFSGGDFSSQIIDKILECGAKNRSLWERTENMWCNQLICVLHLEISYFFITLNVAC